MPLPGPYRTEINLRAGAWMRSTGEILKQGVLLLIDYGYPRHEYYHPQRDRGTLLCHYRHRSHEDPFFYPGLQDITASVDFSALAQAAPEHGLRLAGYTSQAHFLIGCGLADIAASAQNGSGRPDPTVTGQVKRLTLPGEMGERFKAIAFTPEFHRAVNGGFNSSTSRTSYGGSNMSESAFKTRSPFLPPPSSFLRRQESSHSKSRLSGDPLSNWMPEQARHDECLPYNY